VELLDEILELAELELEVIEELSLEELELLVVILAELELEVYGELELDELSLD